MATEMSGVIDEIIRKRKINSKIPKQILDDLNALELNISHLEELQRSFPNLTASTSQKVSQIDFKILKNRIVQEKETWEILWKRLNRDTVNIGVIGLARQGKSTFLQKVSGLTDNEIPSSDRMPCTSVQSNIYHADQNTQAKVYFHSESSFLEQVIKPYYEDLGFSNFPKSVSEFRNSPFPSKPTNPRHPAKAEAVYKHLRDEYYAHIGVYEKLLHEEKRFITIPKNEIKEYVSQDYDENGKPRFFSHLAVEKVEIFSPFPEMKVKKIGLVDMPGLGDTRLGDAERMIRALGQDVDFILFVRRPAKSGDLWGNKDVELYDEASQALSDKLPLQEWSFMLLNQDGENDKQCSDLENTRTNKGIYVKKCIKGNCNVDVSANQVLKEVLDELVNSMDRLDQQYMATAFRDLAIFQDFIKIRLQQARQTIESLGDIETEYLVLKEGFLKHLYIEIENFREQSRTEFAKPNEEFKAQVKEAIDKCNKEVDIPDSLAIESIAKENGIDSAYFDSIQEMRSNFLKQFHSIEDGLKHSLDTTKAKLANIFIGIGLEGVVEKQNAAFLMALAELLTKTNDLPNLAMGFEFISSFEIRYKGFIQSQLWQKFSEVFPPYPLNPVKTPDPTATVSIILKQSHTKAIQQSQSILNDIGGSINKVQISMIEEFADHITRAKGVKLEWNVFLNRNRTLIWTELKVLEEQKQQQKEWLDLVHEALSTTHKLHVR